MVINLRNDSINQRRRSGLMSGEAQNVFLIWLKIEMEQLLFSTTGTSSNTSRFFTESTYQEGESATLPNIYQRAKATIYQVSSNDQISSIE